MYGYIRDFLQYFDECSYLYSYNNLAYGLDTKTGSKSQAYELKCDEIKYETYII